MAKLPPISRFLREDFPDQEWIDSLLWPLNQFMTAVYSGLAKGLTITDNFAGQVKEITVTSNGSGEASTSFAWTGSTIPTDLIVTRVTLVSGSAPSGAIMPTWTYDGSKILISAFTGLANSSTYRIRLIAMSN